MGDDARVDGPSEPVGVVDVAVGEITRLADALASKAANAHGLPATLDPEWFRNVIVGAVADTWLVCHGVLKVEDLER